MLNVFAALRCVSFVCVYSNDALVKRDPVGMLPIKHGDWCADETSGSTVFDGCHRELFCIDDAVAKDDGMDD